MGTEETKGITREELAAMAKLAGLRGLKPEDMDGLLPLVRAQMRQAETLRQIPLDPDLEPDAVFRPDAP